MGGGREISSTKEDAITAGTENRPHIPKDDVGGRRQPECEKVELRVALIFSRHVDAVNVNHLKLILASSW